MPRQPRLDLPHARYHVMNRGARKSPVFLDNHDCAAFLSLLAELPLRYAVRVHAYALMPDHFHLLLETSRANLSEAMRFLTGQYARRFNERYQTDGPVFRGRFKSRLVEDDAWWMHSLAYLHLNPVRARLVRSVDRALWTSHAAYTGRAPRPEWLTTEELLGLFGSVRAYQDHVRDVRLGRESGPEGFDAEALWRAAPTQPRPTDPRTEPGLLSPEEALAQVVAVTGVPASELTRFQRGRPGNRAAWVAAWWLCRTTGLSQAEIGRLLASTQTGVSQRIARLGRARASDPTLAAWTDRLEALAAEEEGPSQDA